MSRSQQILSFVRKGGPYMRISRKGLIKGRNVRKLSLSGSGVARKHEEDFGVTVKYHNRPYQLKDTTPKPKSASKYTPILFKL